MAPRKSRHTEVRILSELVDTYLARREGDLAAKSLQSEREQLHILRDALGDRLLADIEPRDISNVIESYARRLRKAGRSSGTSANRLLGATKRMFKMAKGWGLITRDNPAADLARPAKEEPRQRVLVDGRVLVLELDPATNEVGKLILALRAKTAEIPVSRPLRIAIHLCLLLGVRALEACSLEWSAVRLGDDLPTLVPPGQKRKPVIAPCPCLFRRSPYCGSVAHRQVVRIASSSPLRKAPSVPTIYTPRACHEPFRAPVTGSTSLTRRYMI